MLSRLLQWTGPVLAVVVVLISVDGGSPTLAVAFDACTAAQVSAGDPTNCPNNSASPCNIRSTITLPAAAATCTFDFGTRAVAIGSPSSGGGKLSFGSKMITIKAGSLTIYPNGSIEGVGNGATPNDVGGMATIQTTGGVTLLSGSNQQGKIDVSGKTSGGTVVIDAGDNVSVGATINAGQVANAIAASGGTVRIDSDKGITVSSEITVEGGADSGTGGEIDLNATGQVQITGVLTINGGDGGVANVSAGTTATVGTSPSTVAINGNGQSDFGSGGAASITAARDIQVSGLLNLQGSGTIGVGGGCGGILCVESSFGGITFSGRVLAEGAIPDASGGEIDLVARGTVNVGTSAIISAKSSGVDGCGGGICIETDGDVSLASGGRIDASGGAGGGDVNLTAGRNMTLSGVVDSTGRNVGSLGGTLIVAAGDETSGNLTVTNLLDTSGGNCDPGPVYGCGEGGEHNIVACNLTVSSPNGEIRSRGSVGGTITLASRKQMSISGKVNSSRTATTEIEGTVIFKHLIGSPPTVSGQVSPAANLLAQPACDHPGQDSCLVPCPTCGNGVVEYPETCDTLGTPVNCDGCSSYCRTETPCGDGLTCTTDSCDPAIGCLNLPIAGCIEPTATPTATHTATITPTPTQTRTPTVTPSQSPSATRTRTPTPLPCAGDCNLDHVVSQAEMTAIVSIINLCSGNATGCPAVPGDPKQCLAADIDGNGTISAGELTHILSNRSQFADGCPP